MAEPLHTRVDIYTRVTNQIIEAIEAGAGTWEMPWHSRQNPLLAPVNVSSGEHYRGLNILSLWSQAKLKGYDEPTWGTYRQWSELGRQVAKGEKATLGVFWKPLADRRERGEAQEQEVRPENGPWMAKAFFVFNIAQLEDYESQRVDPKPEHVRIGNAEHFFAGLGADIRHDGDRACYIPSLDRIQMPRFEDFNRPIDYYSTLAHEVTHWTGHEKRLDRDLSGRFGTAAYAAEELIAELGSAFLGAELGLEPELRPDHAAYIDHWLRILKADNRAIFAASTLAQRAADYLQNVQTSLRLSKLENSMQALTPQL